MTYAASVPGPYGQHKGSPVAKSGLILILLTSPGPLLHHEPSRPHNVWYVRLLSWLHVCVKPETVSWSRVIYGQEVKRIDSLQLEVWISLPAVVSLN